MHRSPLTLLGLLAPCAGTPGGGDTARPVRERPEDA